MCILYFILTIFCSCHAFGCKTSRLESIALFSSFEGKSGVYSQENTVEIFDCESSARQYLMVGIGPNVVTPNYVVFHTYNGAFREDPGFNFDFPFQHPLSYEEKLAFYKKQSTALNTCVRGMITDESRHDLRFSTKTNPFCTASTVTKNQGVFQGSCCFFLIQPDSAFKIKFEVPETCVVHDALDVPFTIGLYVSGTDSGNSIDLEPLRFIPGRFSINPPMNVIPTSGGYGATVPTWPTQLASDIYFGNLKIQQNKRATTLQVSFLVDNVCGKRCREGNCVSPCDYMAPIAAEMKLFQKKPKQAQSILLENWYTGGIAFPVWQGEIPGTAHTLQNVAFVEGTEYQLQAVFYDPTNFYNLIKDKIKPFTGLVNKNIVFPRIQVPKIEILKGKEINLQEPIQSALQALDALFIKENWPPYIVEYCNQDLTRCVSTTQDYSKPFIKLTYDFKIEKQTPGEPEIKFLELSREREVNV